jgi:hypothetical protein
MTWSFVERKPTLYAAPGAAMELHGFQEELVLLLGPLLPLLGYHVGLPRLGEPRLGERARVAGIRSAPEISHDVLIIAGVGFLQEEKEMISLDSISRGKTKI